MSYSDMMAALQQKKNQIQQIAQIVQAKEQNIKLRESQLRQSQRHLSGMGRGFGDDTATPSNPVVPGANNPAADLKANLRHALGYDMTPGNIGDINTVIWPFYFPTDIPDSPIAQGQTFQTGFSVTQEAAFIFMSFVKTIYLVEDPGGPAETWNYLDPDQSNPSAPDLVFTLRDGSSSRQLFNTPMDVDNYGNPRFPTKFPRPVMLLPNQVMQIAFINNSPINTYIPFITAFGYRLRVDEAQKLLSLVYA